DGERLVMHWRLSTQKDRTVDEFGILLRNLFALEKIDAQKIRKVIIASVVPPLDPTLNEMVESYFSVKPIFITHENAGIPVLYDDPREVGADRIVNAVAVVRKYGKPAVVDGILVRLKKELGPDTRVIGTGGQAPLICQETRLIETVDPNLTLDGLQLVAARLFRR